jgi:hypothetical protein
MLEFIIDDKFLEELIAYFWYDTDRIGKDDLTAKLLRVLASTVILGSESHGTHDYILLPDGSGSPSDSETVLRCCGKAFMATMGEYTETHRLSFDKACTA